MNGKLANKVPLVAGGSSGIDLGIARWFAEEDARVFITGRRPAELDKVITVIGGKVTALRRAKGAGHEQEIPDRI